MSTIVGEGRPITRASLRHGDTGKQQSTAAFVWPRVNEESIIVQVHDESSGSEPTKGRPKTIYFMSW